MSLQKFEIPEGVEQFGDVTGYFELPKYPRAHQLATWWDTLNAGNSDGKKFTDTVWATHWKAAYTIISKHGKFALTGDDLGAIDATGDNLHMGVMYWIYRTVDDHLMQFVDPKLLRH